MLAIIPSIGAMKRLGVFVFPPWMGCSSIAGLPLVLDSPIPIYTPGDRTQHNVSGHQLFEPRLLDLESKVSQTTRSSYFLQYFLVPPVISTLSLSMNTSSNTSFSFFITVIYVLHCSVHRNYLHGSPDWRQGLL